MTDLTFLGTNTLLIRKGDSAILVDPHFTRPGFFSLLRRIAPDPEKIRTALAENDINTLAAVLLTHTHYDHALDAAEVVRQTGSCLLGSPSAAKLALGAQLPSSQYRSVTAGEANSVGDFRVVFHLSRHVQFPKPLNQVFSASVDIQAPLSPPAGFWQYLCGQVYAIQVDHLLIFGSAGFEAGAYAGLDVDAVILGVGGLDSKPAHYIQRLYQETVLASGARQLLLSHWDNFFRPVNPGLRPMGLENRSIKILRRLASQNGQEMKLLAYGKRIRF